MSDILFIRHAETDMAHTFCGHSDPPVNANGHLQIQKLLTAMETERIDTIYTSDLQRAVTTARALAIAFGVSLESRSSLREIYFGQWEGLTWAEIEQRTPAYASQWMEAYPLLSAPEGESFKTFQDRVMGEVQRILALNRYGCVGIVTHAGVMRLVLRTLCGFDEREAWSSTASYCSFFKYTPSDDPCRSTR